MTVELQRTIAALERSRDDMSANLRRLGETLKSTHDLDKLMGARRRDRDHDGGRRRWMHVRAGGPDVPAVAGGASAGSAGRRAPTGSRRTKACSVPSP
jgi:hypothetical protein